MVVICNYVCYLQQYLVDQFCQAETEILSYPKQNQANQRASDYSGLRELLWNRCRMEEEVSVVRGGRLFILPSNRTGVEQYMGHQMHDIIANSSKSGHPDFL